MDTVKFEELIQSLREASEMLDDVREVDEMMVCIAEICQAGPYGGSYVECVRQAFADAVKYRETVRATSALPELPETMFVMRDEETPAYSEDHMLAYGERSRMYGFESGRMHESLLNRARNPSPSACHRLIQSDPSFEPFKAAALKFIEQRAKGEKADATEMTRLGAEALEWVYSRYFESLKKGDEP